QQQSHALDRACLGPAPLALRRNRNSRQSRSLVRHVAYSSPPAPLGDARPEQQLASNTSTRRAAPSHRPRRSVAETAAGSNGLSERPLPSVSEPPAGQHPWGAAGRRRSDAVRSRSRRTGAFPIIRFGVSAQPLRPPLRLRRLRGVSNIAARQPW